MRNLRVRRAVRRFADNELVATQLRNMPDVTFGLLRRLTGLPRLRLRRALARLRRSGVVTVWGPATGRYERFRLAERPYARTRGGV